MLEASIVAGLRPTIPTEAPAAFASLIRRVYTKEDVRVIGLPDIESVNIGRGVGYAVNEYVVPDDIAGISATEIREMRLKGDNSWKHNVPFSVAEDLDRLSLERRLL
jgi:predicted nucleotidyltransferase